MLEGLEDDPDFWNMGPDDELSPPEVKDEHRSMFIHTAVLMYMYCTDLGRKLCGSWCPPAAREARERRPKAGFNVTEN